MKDTPVPLVCGYTGTEVHVWTLTHTRTLSGPKSDAPLVRHTCSGTGGAGTARYTGRRTDPTTPVHRPDQGRGRVRHDVSLEEGVADGGGPRPVSRRGRRWTLVSHEVLRSVETGVPRHREREEESQSSDETRGTGVENRVLGERVSSKRTRVTGSVGPGKNMKGKVDKGLKSFR